MRPFVLSSVLLCACGPGSDDAAAVVSGTTSSGTTSSGAVSSGTSGPGNSGSSTTSVDDDPEQELMQLELLRARACTVGLSCLTSDHPSIVRLHAAVSAGRMTIDDAALTECLTTPATIIFGDLSEVPTENPPIPYACRDVFVGWTAPGEACDVELECQPDHFCARDDNARAYGVPGGCGTCQARGDVGAPCTAYGAPRVQECQPELHCVDGHCAVWEFMTFPPSSNPGATIGEPCGPPPFPCVLGSECVDGSCAWLPLFGEPCTDKCARGTCLEGKCQSRAIGDACAFPTHNYGDPCGTEVSSCYPPSCVVTGRSGEPCTSATRPEWGHYCSAVGVVTPICVVP